ncbi:MAG: aldehyde dehydrogenase family protein [Streptomyces sp.]|nr:aldehyde dehydrogenase family protein [Streptomyces sp.]
MRLLHRSTGVGRLVAADAAEQLTPCVLELGGHAPVIAIVIVIVTEDADAESAVDALTFANFSSADHSCGTLSRFIVHEQGVDAFIRRLVLRAPAPDSEPGDTMGPLNSARRRAVVHALVEDAVRCAARLVLVGRVPETAGFHYPATAR